MAARKPPQRCALSRSGVTHFLGIPLSTPVSRPQYERACRKVMNDFVSSDIPKNSFMYPEELRLHLGALGLGTADRVSKAQDLLANLDLRDMIRNASPSLASSGGVGQNSEASSGGHGLRVTMQGFSISENQDLAMSRKLQVQVSDQGGVLPRLRWHIHKLFKDKHFVEPSQSDRWIQEDPDRTYANVISAYIIPTLVPNQNKALIAKGIYQNMKAIFDTTGIYHKYQDLIWAKDFNLERLSIYETGLQDILRDGKLISRGYKEIASIPFPGAPRNRSEPRIEGGVYVRHRPIQPSQHRAMPKPRGR